MYLKASIVGDSGIIRCCNHAQYDCLPVTCQCCQSFASVKINVTDMSDYLNNTRKSYDDLAVDSRLLHEPITRDMLSHDPYTPESVDSHSPNPEKFENIDPRRNSVSPEQLKSRLEKIAYYENILKNETPTQIKIKRSISHNANVNGTPREIFRTRAMSELPRILTKVRLISTASVQSTLRLQSHHSSSDEEWFEFEEFNSKCNPTRSLKMNSDLLIDLNENDLEEAKNEKKNECNLFCCSVM